MVATTNDVAIRVAGLGKKYHIGSKQEKYKTLRSTLADSFMAPARRTVRLLRGQPAGVAGWNEILWALQDVSFEVRRGDVIGIIGRNGAGKSTLLKILSRITEPTTGSIDIFGRVGALLEVGTGFHPELTGRENVYLNGAILGMTRVEIERKFDEIVAFAEVDKFIDTPVKHYSSGMGLRLGFAVAAHLEPDILVVDEVLAVGDASFQRKCLGKMSDVASQGRTVLFVSHNMSAINTLCEQCIWLDQGRMQLQGPTKNVVARYLAQDINRQQHKVWPDHAQAPGDHSARLYEVSVYGEHSTEGQYTSTEDIRVRMQFEIFEPLEGFRIGFDLISEQGEVIFRSLYNDGPGDYQLSIPPGLYDATAIIPKNLLNDGVYFIKIVAGIHKVRQVIGLDRILNFEVINIDGVNAQYGGGAQRGRHGLIAPLLGWQIAPAVSLPLPVVQPVENTV
jgi:lipopolysaccharide transport system ATP-binding protein